MPGSGWDSSRGLILAGVGGYLDTLGFIMLGGLFVNHVTGNIVVAAAHPGTQYLAEIVMFPVFYAMVVVGTLLAGKPGGRSGYVGIPGALAVEAVLLAMFMVVGLLYFPHPGSSGMAAKVVVGSLGVGGMAIQTAVTRLAGHMFPTNMVTGTMTMLGMETAGLLSRDGLPGERAAHRRRALRLARVVLAFVVGAVLAAILTSHIHFWAAAGPVVLIALTARRERTERRLAAAAG